MRHSRSGSVCSPIMNGCRADITLRGNCLMSFLFESPSLLVLDNVVLRGLARSETQGVVVAIAKHGEEQQGKDGLREEVQETVPEELGGLKTEAKTSYGQ